MPRVARSRIVSPTIPISLRWVSTKSRSTGAPWPGTTTEPGGEQPEHDVEGERPVHREAVRAEAGHALTKRRLLDQVTGEQHVRVGHPDHQVAAGVAASRVHELDHPVAEIERDGGGERRVGRHDLGRQHLVAVRVGEVVRVVVPRLDPLARRDRVLGGHLVRVHRDRAVLPRKTPLPKVWSKCSWVFTTATTSPAPSARTSSITSRAATADAWVSTTSRPADPRISVTLTSNHS